MIINLLVEGGNMKPGPSLSQQLGPTGINMGQVIKDVNASTGEFKGLKVPVELDVDVGAKTFKVKVLSPPASELLKKELSLKKGSGVQKKEQMANASIEQVISVAKTKFPDLLCKDLKSAVKTMLGTCVSLGIMVESKSPIDVEEEIDRGKYDEEIKEEKTETPQEKLKELDSYFEKIHTVQAKKLKQEKEAAEAAAEEAKAAAPAAEAEKPAAEKPAAGKPAA